VGGSSLGDEALVSGFRYGLVTGVGFVALAALLVWRGLKEVNARGGLMAAASRRYR
jgi:hypothetical protein